MKNFNPIYGRIRVKRGDDLPEGRGAQYFVGLRFEGKEYWSSLECASGEGAVDDIELTDAELKVVHHWEDTLYRV